MKNTVMILNLWSCRNYGAILTCFGVQSLLNKVGYFPKVINFFPRFYFKDHFKDSFSESFSKKYLNLTDLVETIDDFIKLNNQCDMFIVGSDQVWNHEIIKSHHEYISEWIFLLDFVRSSSKKISYSASFGSKIFDNSNNVVNFYKYYLNQFDAISVREDDGLHILKDLFGLNGIQLIDGAFHIPEEFLNKIEIKNESYERYIGFYCLPGSSKKLSNFDLQLDKLSKELNLPIIKMEFNQSVTVERWLTFIKNSKIIISSSYHAIVFAIIFNRPFIQIRHKLTQSRFDSLYSLLEIKNPHIIDLNSNYIDINGLFTIDWNKVNSNISKEVHKAELWIQEVLAKDSSKERDFDFHNNLHILNQKQIVRIKKNFDYLYFKAHKYKMAYNLFRYKLLSYISFRNHKYYAQKLDGIKTNLNKFRFLKKYCKF